MRWIQRRRPGAALAAAGVVVIALAGCSGEGGADPEPPVADPTATEGEPGTDPEQTATEPEPTGGENDPGDDVAEPAPPQLVELYGPEGWDGASGRGVQLEIPGEWTVLDLGEVIPGASSQDGSASDDSTPDDSAPDDSAEGSRADAAAADTPAPEGRAARHWCLVPLEDYPALDGCAGLSVAVGGDWLPGQHGMPYTANQPEGWRPTAEPIRCPFAEDTEDDDADEAEAEIDGEREPVNVVEPVPGESGPLTSDETRIGEHLMRYETWRVSCTESDETFTPRVWQSRTLNVLVRDYVGIPEAVQILMSLEPLEVPVGGTPDAADARDSDGDTATTDDAAGATDDAAAQTPEGSD